MKYPLFFMACGLLVTGVDPAPAQPTAEAEAAITSTSTAGSTSTERSILKTTYPYSDPDPIARPAASIYPYFRFDGYTNTPQEKEWKVVELENEWIKLTIYPEIGGKIWGATEKKTGQKFLYDNSVVKFREVAMRGAWTSGGIEHNFGIIGHAPSTSSPVDYTIRRNDDGSVSCFVGTLDLLTRTWWSVEINLPSDKAYFTTSSHWYNPGPLIEPYYHWMNAGYPVSDSLELCFPGTHHIAHGGETAPWKIDEQGRDISWYHRNNFGGPKSYHVSGSLADYYAGYYHDRGFGSVHHSALGDKQGMKAWIWGLSREGMIWEDLLSDADGQYVELQSGRLYNQEGQDSYKTPYKHFGLGAQSRETFCDYWYPTLGTEGIAATNAYGTLNFRHENDTLTLFFSPLQFIDHPLEVRREGTVIFHEQITAAPLENVTRKIPTPNGKFTLSLGDGLLIYNPMDQPLTRPTASPAAFDWNSLYGRYTRGRQMIYARNYPAAEEALESALAIDSLYAPALTDLSSLRYRQGYMDQAKALASKALSINTYDPEANLVFAAASMATGALADAVDGSLVAALSATHRVAGQIGAAKAYAAHGEWRRTIDYAHKALTGGFNANAYQLLALAHRQLGETVAANEALHALERKLPLNPFVTFERIRQSTLPKEALARSIRSELPAEIFLEMGLWYAHLGLPQEALALYEIVPAQALITYHRAYLTHDKSLLTAAESASADFVFPARVEFLPVLQWAASASEQWKTHYYLALLQLHLNHDTPQALAALHALGTKPNYAPFYLTRALLCGSDTRLADLRRAETLDPSWRVGIALANEYKRLEMWPEMLQTTAQYRARFPKNEPLAMSYVEALKANKRYKESLALMRQLVILPYEGSFAGRQMFRESNLLLSLEALDAKRYKQALQYVDDSEEWIENLGVGKPYDADIDTRSENYLRAITYARMGDRSRATELMEAVAAQTTPLNSNTILTAKALIWLGRAQAAQDLMSAYQKVNNNPDVARWAAATLAGDTAQADQIRRTGHFTANASPFGTNFQDFGFIGLVTKLVDL